MYGKEMISDITFKWDNFAKSTNSDKTLKFIVKKRIFMEPKIRSTISMEERLLLFQAMEDIVNDKFPVTEEEAVWLASLRAQAEHGDYNDSNPLS